MPRPKEAAQIAVMNNREPISSGEIAQLVATAVRHTIADLPLERKLEIYRAALASGQLGNEAAIGVMQAIITLTRDDYDPRSNINLLND